MKSHALLLALALLCASCGNHLSKGKLPTNNTSTNTASNNVTSTNQTTAVTNGTTAMTTNTVTTTNNTNNTTTTNNTTATTNNTTVLPPTNIAYIAGATGTLSAVFQSRQIAYDLVGSDDPTKTRELESFFLNDLPTYQTLVIDTGKHFSNMEDMGVNTMPILNAIESWLSDGGTLVDLSGGATGRLYPNFTFFDGKFAAAGTYTGSTYAPLTARTFEFSTPSQAMVIAPLSSVSEMGETILADAEVQACDIPDFNCTAPVAAETVVVASKTVGAGIVYVSYLQSPLTADAVSILLELLP